MVNERSKRELYVRKIMDRIYPNDFLVNSKQYIEKYSSIKNTFGDILNSVLNKKLGFLTK